MSWFWRVGFLLIWIVLIAPIINQGLSTYSLSFTKGNQGVVIALLFGAIQSIVFVIGFIPILLKWFPNVLKSNKKDHETKFNFNIESIINPKNKDEKFYRNKILIICSGIIVLGYALIFNAWLMPLLILLYLTYLYFEQY